MIGDSCPVCDDALTAAVAHLKPSANKEKADLRLFLAEAVSIRLAWCLLTCVIDAAFKATPASSADSSGHPMGFNDRLSAEHYMILIGNFRPHHMLSEEYGYDWLLIGARDHRRQGHTLPTMQT